MAPQIVFFDLDHTLLRRNSSFSFGLYLYNKKLISCLTLAKLYCFYILHKFDRIGIEELHQRGFNCLFAGKQVSDFKTVVEDFLDENLESLKNTPALIRFNEAKRRGDHVVILSSSPDFLVEAFARKFQVDFWRATEYLVEEGAWTKLGCVMEGGTKALHVSELSEKLSVPLHQTIGYSDSHLDLLFLEKVGKPVAVNPTRSLLRIAKKRNWEVLHCTSKEPYSSVLRNHT